MQKDERLKLLTTFDLVRSILSSSLMPQISDVCTPTSGDTQCFRRHVVIVLNRIQATLLTTSITFCPLLSTSGSLEKLEKHARVGLGVDVEGLGVDGVGLGVDVPGL